MAGQGDFGGLPGVLETRKANGRWHLALAKGTDPHAILRALATKPGVRLTHFELAEPSLDDIFVSVVGSQRTAGRQPLRETVDA